jgi:transposase InsO family protein
MLIPQPSTREEVALFRRGIVGDLLAQDLPRGELRRELIRRSKVRYLPPGADEPRRFAFKTLQRWYYDLKRDPVDGLMPEARARGFALALDDDQRWMLLEMRREHPSAAAELLLDEAIRHGIVAKDQISVATLRRLYAAEGLSRLSMRRAKRKALQRRRWRAAKVCDLWHGDVCVLLLVDEHGDKRRFYVHGFLDDASRFCPALVARSQEREVDMLEVLCGALLRYPPPRTLYFDRGGCYRGDLLGLVCRRLGINLVHATPGDPEARGTQERFFRTMRQRCTDHLAPSSTLHAVNSALSAWIDADYHRRSHAGLMGETPRREFLRGIAGQRKPFTPRELAKALETSVKRRVKKDATFTVGGSLYEVTGAHLAGKYVNVVLDGLTERPLGVSYQDQAVRFGPCDPVANADRKRVRTPVNGGDNGKNTPFDPITALLQKAREVDDE